MYLYEMIGVADDNEKTYESKYGTYNNKDRFKFNEEAKRIVDKGGYRELFDILAHENLWKLKSEPVREMSLQDIEKELGYRVRLMDPQPEKKEIDEEHRKKVNDTIDFFKDFFGLNLDPEDYY